MVLKVAFTVMSAVLAMSASRAAAADAPSARDIIARAQAAAGGETWVRPRAVLMRGFAVFYTPQGTETHERYDMWRVYPAQKGSAHAGPQPPSEADKQWSENFGFGVIRFALEEGFRQERLPDDSVEARPVYVVRIIDPSGQTTLFSIAQDDYAILKLAFDTSRGWHERFYSGFFRKPGVSWVQPGLVRLYYDGVKQNEIHWTDFELDHPMPDELFVVPAPAR